MENSLENLYVDIGAYGVNYGNTYGFEQLMGLVTGLQTLPRMLKKIITGSNTFMVNNLLSEYVI